MNSFTYYNPVHIEFGINSLNKLSSYVNGRKALIVSSEGFVKRGVISQIKTILDKEVVGIITNITPNPDFENLKIAYASIAHLEIEVIVALGGGSVIDSSKVFSLKKNDFEFSKIENIIRNGWKDDKYKTVPIIAIPTTAGTGSELTPWATIWDMKEKKKFSLHLENLFPEVAICDPELTLTVPKNITIQTALDTLSHSLESLWNLNTNVISQQLAIQSAKIILTKLPLLVNDLSNVHLRAEIMLACICAGKAFSNTATSTAHAMSYYLTAEKKIPHGIACSITLPAIVETLINKHDWLDDLFLRIFADSSVYSIKMFFKKIDTSINLHDYNVTEDDLKNIKSSLKNNVRAANGIVDIEDLFTLILKEYRLNVL